MTMDQRLRRLIAMGVVATVCLLLVTARVPAQQHDALQDAYSALGARTVTTLQLRGFGAMYGVVGGSAPRAMAARVALTSYEAEIDFTQAVMREHLVREDGSTPPQVAPDPTRPIWAT